MTVEQAIQNIRQALRVYRGTLDEHEALQQSLEKLITSIPKEPFNPDEGPRA
jgi:predicted RNase H-like HicB family nuclease